MSIEYDIPTGFLHNNLGFNDSLGGLDSHANNLPKLDDVRNGYDKFVAKRKKLEEEKDKKANGSSDTRN